jgi:hypothetical protein
MRTKRAAMPIIERTVCSIDTIRQARRSRHQDPRYWKKMPSLL